MSNLVIDLENLDRRTLDRRLWVAETRLRDVRRRYRSFHPVAMKSQWKSDHDLGAKLATELAAATEQRQRLRDALARKKAGTMAATCR